MVRTRWGALRMPWTALRLAWTAKVSNHQLVRDRDIQAEATHNMLVFVLSRAEPAALSDDQLNHFLMETFHAFCKKAARLRITGWFYAWFDEMSGTLRCSACSVVHPLELPFSCRLHIVDSPYEVTRAVAKSNYISGIPTAEFQKSETGSDQDSDLPFTLTVFARPMIGPT